MYISGNTGLIFNLLDNLFRNTATPLSASNGISIWGSNVNTIDVQDNVWNNTRAWAMNLNNCHGSISNNQFNETGDYTGFDPVNDWWKFQSGILLANPDFDLDISNNTFLNNVYCLNIYANTDGTIDVEENTFDGTRIASVRASASQPLGGTDLDDLTVRFNSFINFEGSGTQIVSSRTDGQEINATCNWWGTAVKSEVEALVDASAKVLPYEQTENGVCECYLEGGPANQAYYRPSSFYIAGEWLNISVNGGTDGSIQTHVPVGTPPLTYTWTSIPSYSLGNSPNLNGLKAGSYFLIVTDSEGCIAKVGPWTLKEPD